MIGKKWIARFAALPMVTFLTASAWAAVFDDGAVHTIADDTYYQAREAIEVYDGPGGATTVDVVTNGALWQVFAYESTRVNVSDGVSGHLLAHDSTHAVYSGGRTWAVAAYGSSQIEILDGRFISSLLMEDSSRWNISGGDFENNVNARGTSTIDVSGGTFARTLYANLSSQVNVSGGSFGELSANGSSQVDVQGGTFNYLTGYSTGQMAVRGGSIDRIIARHNSQMDFYGHGLQWSGVNGDLLTGFLADGTAINATVLREDDAVIALHIASAVPEPASIALWPGLALMGVIAIRRRRQAV